MEGISMNVFRGLTIMLLTIIAYMIMDSLFKIPLLTIMLCTASGALIVFSCKGMDRSELNMFRASLFMGIAFFVLGNYLILNNIDEYKVNYDQLILYYITMGFLLSAIGMIVMFSSIPIIIYKDIEEHFKRKREQAHINYDKI